MPAALQYDKKSDFIVSSSFLSWYLVSPEHNVHIDLIRDHQHFRTAGYGNRFGKGIR